MSVVANDLRAVYSHASTIPRARAERFAGIAASSEEDSDASLLDVNDIAVAGTFRVTRCRASASHASAAA